jgi:hypothetical protein
VGPPPGRPGDQPAPAWAAAPLLTSPRFDAAYARARQVITTGWPAKAVPLLRSGPLVRFVRSLPTVDLRGQDDLVESQRLDVDRGWALPNRLALAQSLLVLADERAAVAGQGATSRRLRNQLAQARRGGLSVVPVPVGERERLLADVWAAMLPPERADLPVLLDGRRRAHTLRAPGTWLAVRDDEQRLVALDMVVHRGGGLARLGFMLAAREHPHRKQARYLLHHAMADALRAAGVVAMLSGSALHLNPGMVNFQRWSHYRVVNARG